jgi:hypothetical protein
VSARALAVALAVPFVFIPAPARAATSLFGAAWSEVVLDQGSRLGADRAGLVAKSIDGRTATDHGTIRLQPGVHTLVLQWNPKGSFSRTPGHVLRLDAKPCKRYVVVARFPFSSSASTSSWQPFVKKTEEIIGCTPAAAVPEGVTSRSIGPPKRPPAED